MKKLHLLLAFTIVLSACNVDKETIEVKLPSSLEAGENEELARGIVYHDSNDNQVKDDNENGIQGVIVSNGIQLVQTNEKGEYEIPVTDDAVIFLVKPKDWRTPVNEFNLPQFFYIHKPNGSADNYTYKGIEPTGDLPESINFPLYPEEASESFKILVFGDTQPYDIAEVDFLAEDIVVELIGRDDVAFGLTMGDIVGDNLDLFSPLNRAVAKIGVPWYNVLGNHDVNYMGATDKLSDDTYERVYGPSTYAFVKGSVHFLILDDVIHESKAGSHNYVGGFRSDQLTFIESYLKTVSKEDLIVLSMHIPLAKQDKTFRKSDQKALFDLLKDFPNTLSISAHTHVQDNRFFHQASSDWQQEQPHHHFNVGTTCGSWWNGFRTEKNIPHTMMRDGTPNGYAFISFEGSDYSIDWKAAGSPEDHRMNIHVPRGLHANSGDSCLLTVNFFNGSEFSELEYRIEGESDWQKMDKVEKKDPYYLKLWYRWDYLMELNLREEWNAHKELGKEPLSDWDLSDPDPCTHLWQVDLGTERASGTYLIEVRAKDRYGNVFTDYQILRLG